MLSLMNEVKLRTLHLTLKRNWFEMIRSGVKMEEYRDCKPYWAKRLENKTYDVVEFRNGYRPDSPCVIRPFEGCVIREGPDACHPDWGEPTRDHYVISLGDDLIWSGWEKPMLPGVQK